MNTNKLIGRSTAGSGVMEEITIGPNLTLVAGTLDASPAVGGDTSVGVMFDGQGGVIAINSVGTIQIPFNGTITGWILLETSSTPIAGSIVIDAWKDTYVNYPPTVADTIWGTKPSLTTAIKNTATGLSIAVSSGDIIKFNVDSVTSCVKVRLVLFITKT